MSAFGQVVVEASRDKWIVRKNGFSVKQYNYKNAAVKKARKIARENDLTLKIYNKNGSVSETVKR